MKNQTIISETREEKRLPLEAKPLLTLKEASVYTGIGINMENTMDFCKPKCYNYSVCQGSSCLMKGSG